MNAAGNSLLIECFRRIDELLLTDAETAEDLSQQFIAAEASGDHTQAVLGHAQVFGNQLRRAVMAQCSVTTLEMVGAIFKGKYMPFACTEVRAICRSQARYCQQVLA